MKDPSLKSEKTLETQTLRPKSKTPETRSPNLKYSEEAEEAGDETRLRDPSERSGLKSKGVMRECLGIWAKGLG